MMHIYILYLLLEHNHFCALTSDWRCVRVSHDVLSVRLNVRMLSLIDVIGDYKIGL